MDWICRSFFLVSYSSEIYELVMPMAKSLPLIAKADLVKLPTGLANGGCPMIDPGDEDFPDSLPSDFANAPGASSLNETTVVNGLDADNSTFDPESGSTNDSFPFNYTRLEGEDVDSSKGLLDSATWALVDWFNWLGHQISGYGFWPPLGLCLILIMVLYLAWGWVSCRLNRLVATSSHQVAAGTTAAGPQDSSSTRATAEPQASPQPPSTGDTPPQDLPPPLEDPNAFTMASMIPSGPTSEFGAEQPPPPLDFASTPAPPLGSFNSRRPKSLNLVADYPSNPPNDVENPATAGGIICTSV